MGGSSTIPAGITEIKTETDKIPTILTETNKIASVKTETDKISAEVVKTAALNTAIGTLADEEDKTTVCGRLYTLGRHFHGRNRSYPFTGAGITLTGSNTANEFGAFAEIIPVLSNEVNTLTVTHACNVAGNIVIRINGTIFVCPVTQGDANHVAAELRALTYTGAECGDWTITGSLAEVIFTRAGISTTGTFSDPNNTGVTATIVKTNTGSGVNKPFDIHFIQGGIANKKDTYIIELCSGLAGYEKRIGNLRISTEADNSAAGMIPIMSEIMPAGTRISARVASLSGGTDTIVISLNYHVY